MRKIIFFLVFFVFTYAELNQSKLDDFEDKINKLDAIINSSIYNIRYENFITYQKINDELILLNLELKKPNLKQSDLDELKRHISTLEEQLNLLSEYKDLNFAQSLSAPENVEILPKLTNPLAIISGFSHIKKLKGGKEEVNQKLNDFTSLVEKIKEKNTQLKEESHKKPHIIDSARIKNSDKKLDEFNQALQFAKVSYSIYEKKIDDEIARINLEIKIQTLRAINILIAIVLSIIISFSLKFVAKKYIKDIERYYMATKIINFININVIFLILLFAYIENITYLVTILGFASAGLAIAMKDMFMSMLGWCVIVFGGSLRTGDRIKVIQNNLTYVGDIIDISFLRITIYEDITLESYVKNRRSGRIIFIPNNYVFTHLISNYTHHGMRTVLDGIDITITFDSNLEKAQQIVENIVKFHAKGYTELARKTMQKLQNEYSIKDIKVAPRFFIFFEHWGMRISAWYMTNSYAALALRSVICKDIIIEFNKHKDIKIAYPSQNLYMSKNLPPDEFKELAKDSF
ncbi:MULTISPECIES: mechanosensitive ion channel family protein [unclassified Campylobacter]|uniref:mechanosensitive ion channel family protein n=1 Tax=unclassified Campylobacter TaxID=2593542 RepID=UPI0012381FAF|nr:MULTISPECIES: mechanosensitive ion channel family protein [unclassified Campylobacter]KAA6226410.1 mechanosensitive ion channel family protein [Campylobacter sp. LR286c]KAA6226552.1 mechanosensitive ion channel family protein [Campylobacter sp. LR185c]KAA6226898.1 mechanosensitive ion channel family protein [Campylobacter sp. LR196d]KAA6233642.1 mechanosensitive ion channel family protein [Campylobacter sp. LR291e]KAA6233862.1 mechanosensitive ion channel family protein [Campylobacter sp. L